MPIKVLLSGGGGSWFFCKGGGWKWQCYFCGRGDFSDWYKNRVTPFVRVTDGKGSKTGK